MTSKKQLIKETVEVSMFHRFPISPLESGEQVVTFAECVPGMVQIKPLELPVGTLIWISNPEGLIFRSDDPEDEDGGVEAMVVRWQGHPGSELEASNMPLNAYGQLAGFFSVLDTRLGNLEGSLKRFISSGMVELLEQKTIADGAKALRNSKAEGLAEVFGPLMELMKQAPTRSEH
jgi:hypothetical protein